MLRFGTSGIPRSSRRPDTPAGIARARELGLDCLEMAWVNGVTMRDETADRIAEAAREHRIELTAHAPYFVNLCGAAQIRMRSVRRLLDAARLAHRCGARSLVFHVGFYGERRPPVAARGAGRLLASLARRVRDRGWTVDLRPELTGRPSQLGSLEELMEWCSGIEGLHPCIDFAHHYARSQGRLNDYAAFRGALEEVGKRLGRPALERLHVHLSGIELGTRGERRHLPLLESAFRWREAVQALRDLGVSGWVLCESPLQEFDALRLRRYHRRAA